MSPAEPVMTAIDIELCEKRPEVRFVFANPAKDIRHNRLDGANRPPRRLSRDAARITNKQRNVKRRCIGMHPDGHLRSDNFTAKLRQLQQQYRNARTAAHIEGPGGFSVCGATMLIDEIKQIERMQQVAHLLALAAKPRVLERPPEIMPRHP